MTTNSGVLTMNILEYWHAGTGEAGGGDLDLVVVRDRLGLPYLPARTVKGLLRDAIRVAGSFNHVSAEATEELFGLPATEGNPESSKPGCLRIEDARVPTELRAWAEGGMAGKTPRPELDGLFETLAQTAIHESRGVARKGSLRKIEATMPLELKAEICLFGSDLLHNGKTWSNILETCAPLIRGIGLGRHRGLGRCRCSFSVSSGGKTAG